MCSLLRRLLRLLWEGSLRAALGADCRAAGDDLRRHNHAPARHSLFLTRLPYFLSVIQTLILRINCSRKRFAVSAVFVFGAVALSAFHF